MSTEPTPDRSADVPPLGPAVPRPPVPFARPPEEPHAPLPLPPLYPAALRSPRAEAGAAEPAGERPAPAPIPVPETPEPPRVRDDSWLRAIDWADVEEPATEVPETAEAEAEAPTVGAAAEPARPQATGLDLPPWMAWVADEEPDVGVEPRQGDEISETGAVEAEAADETGYAEEPVAVGWDGFGYGSVAEEPPAVREESEPEPEPEPAETLPAWAAYAAEEEGAEPELQPGELELPPYEEPLLVDTLAYAAPPAEAEDADEPTVDASDYQDATGWRETGTAEPEADEAPPYHEPGDAWDGPRSGVLEAEPAESAAEPDAAAAAADWRADEDFGGQAYGGAYGGPETEVAETAPDEAETEEALEALEALAESAAEEAALAALRAPDATGVEPPAEPAIADEPVEEAGAAAEASLVPEAAAAKVIEPHEVNDLSAVALNEVADRLERIATSLRTRSPAELLARSGNDPLELLLAGFALGYASGKQQRDEPEHQ